MHCPTGFIDPFGLAGCCPPTATNKDDAILGPRGILKNDSRPGQSHHLNQDAAYRDVIPTNKGAAINVAIAPAMPTGFSPSLVARQYLGFLG